MLEGVLAIVEGLNPKLIRIKLDAYIVQAEIKKPETKKAEKKAEKKAPETKPKAAADTKPAGQTVAAGS